MEQRHRDNRHRQTDIKILSTEKYDIKNRPTTDIKSLIAKLHQIG